MGDGIVCTPLLILSAVSIAWSDVTHRRVPNVLAIIVLLTAVWCRIQAFGLPGAWSALGGAGVGFGILMIPYLAHMIGAGDVKAAAALAAWFDPGSAVVATLLGLIAGGVISVYTLLVTSDESPRRGAMRVLRTVQLFAASQLPSKGVSLSSGPSVPLAAGLAFGALVVHVSQRLEFCVHGLLCH